MRTTWIGAWLSGAVLALSLLSFAGASAASAQTAPRAVVAQATCPTDPYTGASTPCDNGATNVAPGAGTPISSTSPSGGGSLASTGADILMGLLAAALLILLGTTLILAARQRRQTA